MIESRVSQIIKQTWILSSENLINEMIKRSGQELWFDIEESEVLGRLQSVYGAGLEQIIDNLERDGHIEIINDTNGTEDKTIISLVRRDFKIWRGQYLEEEKEI